MINKPIILNNNASGKETLPIKYSKKLVGFIPTKCKIHPIVTTVIVAKVEAIET